MAYETELMTFAVKVGMEAKADEWMRVLVERKAECIATLDREKMHYECIFKSIRNGRLYLSWFSVQGTAGEHVRSSMNPIDKVHMDYWNECIDREVPPEKPVHVVSFVPASVEQAVNARDAP
jgi:hypothetical protein